MNIERPDASKLMDYVKTRGRAAERTVAILTKNYQHFSNVYNTEIGQDLLSYKIKKHNILIEKILDKAITPLDRDMALQEFFWIDNEIGMESEKIKRYLDAVEKINR
jgi:hypothetical protein